MAGNSQDLANQPFHTLSVCGCFAYMPVPPRSQKGSRAPGTVVRHLMVLGINPEPLGKTASALNNKAFSPSPEKESLAWSMTL